jgi:hypothetical protein
MNTTNPTPPDAVLLQNCTLHSYNSLSQVVYNSSIPAGYSPVGPCRLILSPDGVLSIIDLGGDGLVVWSNAQESNKTTSSCSPYSLAVLTSGTVVEKDCQNKTVRCGCLFRF